MKLKSLLLGSAAVFVAVSGARAADAIIVEPEPVEYVRVCDVYGPGYYYIPGTETCLKFAGQLRVTYDTKVTDHDEDLTNHSTSYRFRFHVYADNETEYGRLSSWVRYTSGGFNMGNVANSGGAIAGGADTNAVFIDNAVISLGGFRVGRLSDSYWDNTGGAFFTNGTIVGVVTNGGSSFGFYGATAAWFADYTWAANGWTVTVGVQDPSNDSVFANNTASPAISTIGRPDVYAGVTYATSGLEVRGVVAWDSGTTIVGNTNGGLAWKAGFTYDFGNGWMLGGWYGSDSGDTDYIGGHLWGVTASWKLADNWKLAGYYTEFDDQIKGGTAQQYGAELRWDIVTGLDMTVGYEKLIGDSTNSMLSGADSSDAFRVALTRRF